MPKLLQINPVIRNSTSTGKIMREIGELAVQNGWESYIAYSKGRDGYNQEGSKSVLVPVGSKLSVAIHGLETRLFDRHGLGSRIATYRFIKDIKKINPDVIHIHNIHGYFLNYKSLFRYLASSGKPLIWTVHDSWLYTGHCYYYSASGCSRWKEGCGHCPQKKAFPCSWLLDRSGRNYRDKSKAFNSVKEQLLITPVSDWIRSEMSSSFLNGCRFRVVHNGIDTEVFKPCDTNSVRENYQLGDKYIILCVASIWSKEKGFEDILKMSEMISEDEIIVAVGKMTEQQKRMLPENVIAISCTDNQNQLAELYSAATVFVNPTWQDNYPTVNLEAISCGTPVVTYRTGGSPESIVDGKTGFVVNQGDVDAIIKAIRIIESNGTDHYSSVCRLYAVTNFRKEDRYRDYLGLYDSFMTPSAKILQLGKFYPILGGVEKVMWDLTRGLSGRGVKCDMLCACLRKDMPQTEEGEFGSRVIRFNESGRCICVPAKDKKAATMIAPAMVSWLRRHASDYDMIHIHHPDPMACLALWMSGYRGRVYLHWHSDIVKQKLLGKLYAPLQTWLLKRADRIIGTTPVYVEQSPYLQKYQSKLAYLSIGIEDNMRIVPAPDTEPHHIFSLGRLVGYKGYRYLVESAKWLPDGYRIEIGGGGPLMAELQGLIEDEGLGGKVSLLGRLSDEQARQKFNSCDVFVLPSIMKTEAFGIVQIEAMSCAKPVIATTIPGSGTSWVNADGESGLNVPPCDAKALADAVVAICSDRERHQKYAIQARRRFEEMFTLDVMVDGYLKLI